MSTYEITFSFEKHGDQVLLDVSLEERANVKNEDDLAFRGSFDFVRENSIKLLKEQIENMEKLVKEIESTTYESLAVPHLEYYNNQPHPKYGKLTPRDVGL